MFLNLLSCRYSVKKKTFYKHSSGIESLFMCVCMCVCVCKTATPTQQGGEPAAREGDATAADWYDEGAGHAGHFHTRWQWACCPNARPWHAACRATSGIPWQNCTRPPAVSLSRLLPWCATVAGGAGLAVGGQGHAATPSTLGQQSAELQRTAREAEHPGTPDEHTQWAEGWGRQHAETAHETGGGRFRKPPPPPS